MRKLILLFMVLPLLGIAQNKNLMSVDRYFPKTGKAAMFEKALAAHAQKYHKGDHSWRVYSIETGPDAGGYQVVEGPTNWTGIDNRGDLGDAHTKDWQTTVQPHVEDKFSFMYVSFREDLSTVALGDFLTRYLSPICIINPVTTEKCLLISVRRKNFGNRMVIQSLFMKPPFPVNHGLSS